MSVFHPSGKSLGRWLDTGQPTKTGAHVDGCRRCSDRLVDIAAPEGIIGDALRDLLTTPPGLHNRVQSRLDTALRDREDLQLLAELFGLPWHTATALRTDDDD